MSTVIPAQITPIHHPHAVIIKEKIYFSLTYTFLFTGKENKYIKLNHEFYCYPKNASYRIHKNLFKNKELCIVLATFRYDYQEECYNLEFIGDRPLQLVNWDYFRELVKYGFEQLNPQWYEK